MSALYHLTCSPDRRPFRRALRRGDIDLGDFNPFDDDLPELDDWDGYN